MKPGAIRCGQGHNHIYFPRDFGFRMSAVPIAEPVMQENRDAYRAINLPGRCSPHDLVTKANEPEAEVESSEPEDELKSPKSPSEHLGPDPRREAAQLAGKERWANWAVRKMA